MRYRSLVSILACACAADGVPGRATDAAPPGADASPASPDAAVASATGDIAGTWRFELGAPDSPDRVGCDATVGYGSFSIVCPTPLLPEIVGPDCRRARRDLRITGTLEASLAGRLDLVEEFEGSGCGSLGFPAGLPIVEDVATMWAERTAPGVGEGFWAAVDGTWTWEIDYTPTSFLRCDVTLAGGTFAILCPDGEPTLVAYECTESRATRLDGTVTAQAMSAELLAETTRDGTGCLTAGLSLYERSESVPLSATRQ